MNQKLFLRALRQEKRCLLFGIRTLKLCAYLLVNSLQGPKSQHLKLKTFQYRLER